MKAIVFDFDGVLADSFDVLYDFNREAMASVGVELSAGQYRDLFDRNVHLGFRQFIPDDAKYRKFVDFKQERFGEYYEKVDLFPGAAELVKNLASGMPLAIASATLAPHIVRLLEKHGIAGCFNHIVGSQDHSKAKSIEMIRDQLNASYDAMAMVSDTTGDLAIAKELGLKTVAVAWGFHSVGKLSEAAPSATVLAIGDLASILTSI
jgi:phosphoglycolate phosphatase